MEFRQSIKITIILAFIVSVISLVWYVGLPKEREATVTKKTDIPGIEAKDRIKTYDPKYSYYYSQDFVVVRNKTMIPFKYVNDTIYRGKMQAMHDEN